MLGTYEGAAKMIVKVKEKYGLDDDGRSLHHVRVGRLGGMKRGFETKSPKGFAANPSLAREAGRLGGMRSRRPKRKIISVEEH